MLLRKGEGTIGGQKVAKHAGKHTAIVSIALLGGVGGRLDELPLVGIGQRTALLGHVLVLEVLHQPLEIPIAAAGHGIVELNALLGHVDDGDGPVHAGHVDCGIGFTSEEKVGMDDVDLGWVRCLRSKEIWGDKVMA